MNRPLLVALALLPALSACRSHDVLPPEQYNLSGTLHGDWGASPRIRLALVGTGLPNVLTNNSSYAQNVVTQSATGRSFGFDLPSFPNLVGVYQVIAFDDANNNAQYDIGEKFARNRLWLIYSPTDTTTPSVNLPEQFPWAAGEEALPAMNVKRGWNVYDRSQRLSATNPLAVQKVTGYDIWH